jgi:hypothetical protein
MKGEFMYRIVLLICCILLASIAMAQSGENCATAIPIASLPFCYNGTTVGFNADYIAPCSPVAPGPDVVFVYQPTTTQVVSAGLCGSSFNTLLHIWMNCPPNGTVICCNDDFCGVQSCCENLTFVAGNTYYIIVAGSFGASGNYSLHVVNSPTCPGPCSTTICPYPDRDQEPLNNYCNEIYDTLACGDTICGAISPNGDIDYYHIRIPGPGCQRLTIDVFGNGTPGWSPFGQGLDPIVYLMDSVSCTTYLASDDNSGIGNDAHLVSPCLRPGLYRLRIEGSGTPPTVGPYILAVSCTQCACNPCPYPNRDQETLNNFCNEIYDTLVCGDTVCGRINPLGDVDYYHIRIPGPGCEQLNINVFGNGTPGWPTFGQGLDPIVYLMDSVSCTTYLALDDNGGIGNDAHLVSPCLRPGLYRIRIEGSGNPQTMGPYILATSCSPCTCTSLCPYPNRDLEPINNTCNSANAPLACPDTVCGTIDNNTGVLDADWYTFTIPAPGCRQLTINVYGNGTPGWYPYGLGLDPLVELYAADCVTLLGSDDNSGIANDSRLVSACLQPGTYNIKVMGVGGTQGPYVIATSCTQCACNPPPCPYPNRDQEPLNNYCLEIYDTLACGDTVCGTINPLGDEDYYHLLIPGPQCEMVTLNVFGNGTPGYFPYGQGLNPFVSLYGGNCTTPLYQDDNSGIGNDAYLFTACLSPGVYKIKVNASGNATTGPYILAVFCHPCTCASLCPYPNRDLEPINNTCNSANASLACPDTVCGTIDNNAGVIDVDWYSITIPPPACLQLTVNVYGNGTPGWYPFGLGLDPRVELYASDCSTLLGFDDNSGVAGDSRMVSPCLQPGTYMISVQGAGGTQGPYVLRTACAQCQCACVVPCPPQLPMDGEACPNFGPDTYNGGCSVTPPAFGVIECGHPFCATAFAMGGIRDQDWYRLNVTSPRRIRWFITSSFPFEMAIYAHSPGICDTIRLRYTTGLPCQTRSLYLPCLPVGTYYLYIAPTVLNGVPCSNYISRLACGHCLVHGVVVNLSSNTIQLAWDGDETLPVFNVYRSTDPNVPQLPENLIGFTSDTTFVDTTALQRPDVKSFYTITMQDPDSNVVNTVQP